VQLHDDGLLAATLDALVLRDTLNGDEQTRVHGDDFGPVCHADDPAQPVG